MFVMLVIVGCIWRKPVSNYAISVLIGGFGEQQRRHQQTPRETDRQSTSWQQRLSINLCPPMTCRR